MLGKSDKAPFRLEFELDVLGGELFVDVRDGVNLILKGGFVVLIQVTKKIRFEFTIWLKNGGKGKIITL